jgi:hypothetical protein
MEEEERIKKIAELREVLEERTKKLEVELQGVQALLDFINEVLIEKSFKRAEQIAKPPPAKPAEAKPARAPQRKPVRTVPLKADSGMVLARLHVDDAQIRIVPAPDIRFNVDTPPFTAFLIERIFAKMVDKDRELVNQGKLVSDKAFSYEVKRDGDVLQEIVVRNIAPQRERELRSATRWTFEKMYDKMQGTA